MKFICNIFGHNWHYHNYKEVLESNGCLYNVAQEQFCLRCNMDKPKNR